MFMLKDAHNTTQQQQKKKKKKKKKRITKKQKFLGHRFGPFITIFFESL